MFSITFMKRFTLFPIFLVAIAVFFLTSCEEEFIPEPITDAEQIVVEGYVEAGENATPPYVILTKSLAFFSEIDPNVFNDIFIKGAQISVSDGENTIQLTELCLGDLPPELIPVATEFLGFDPTESLIEFCIYVDIMQEINPQIGKRYDLNINVNNQTLTATTTIPQHVPIDSLEFREVPGNAVDTLAQLRAWIQDPANEENYYRYLTQINDSTMFAGVTSVVDDRLFDGQYFDFPLSKHEPRNVDFNTDTYGYYFTGDTLTLKWLNMDKEHFDFWNTLEFNAINQGPFSSYTRVDFNINGGLGIWGGYSSSTYTLLVEK